MKHHKERVHEYGETCNIYPCEDCGFQGQDIRSLKQHISESHDETCLEQLGIKQLPYYSKRIKQNFNGLSIDKDGSFEVEESEEEYEMEETIVNNSRKRRVTERLQTKKRPKVSQIKEKTKFICDICNASLSRKDSLTRHIKKCTTKIIPDFYFPFAPY